MLHARIARFDVMTTTTFFEKLFETKQDLNSKAKPCLDCSQESVFTTVALSFVFDNYCPIMI